MREGVQAANLQRAINNLDRRPGSDAPTQTGPTHEPRNAAFVAHYIERLEDELGHIPVALEALEREQVRRRLMWDLGLARKPRAVTVGRAIYELGALTVDDVFKARNHPIAKHLNKPDKRHHLSQAIIRLVESFDKKAAAKANAALAPHLRPALKLLESYGWLRAAHQGVYLVGDGRTLFVNFPEWHWRDEEPEPKLNRPRRKYGRPSA